ncbi:MAG: hypothetical protein IT369_16515, partial [Candidatus Latescibacteria bacterium]|nr:hypothetical protein [Candidatus Latescibacterota bacterium]
LFNKIQAANAAEILQRNGELSDTTVARLMQKLQPAQRAKIMGFWEPVFAARIAKLMAESAEAEVRAAQLTPQAVQSATLNRPSDAAQLPYYYEATGIRKILCDRPGDPLHPESYRGCRRLHFLREWSHDKTDAVFARGARAGRSDGPGAPA